MNFDKTQKELLSYVSANPIWKLFVPFAELIFVGGSILYILISLNILNIGGFSTLVVIIKYVALVITLAKGNYFMIMIGCALQSLSGIIDIIQGLTWQWGKFFSFSGLFYALAWGYLTYLAYKKTKKS